MIDDGVRRDVAVKILRPGIERRFRRDLDSYFFAARQIERFHPPTRRLRPIAVVETLARTSRSRWTCAWRPPPSRRWPTTSPRDQTPDGRFRVPTVDWRRTAQARADARMDRRHPDLGPRSAVAAGHDLKALGLTVLRSFLRHAMRDGFFHADMHQGNLLVDKAGRVVAVDFGIMGRLGAKERRFLAEILHGLITRDYRRTAAIHFEAGYVPPHHSVEVFAQAMRAIGEPIHGRTAEEISMADLLGQLFAYTEVFDMADAARAAAAAEDHGGGGGRRPLARPGAQHLERRRAHRESVDAAEPGRRGAAQGCGRGQARSDGCLLTCPNSSRRRGRQRLRLPR